MFILLAVTHTAFLDVTKDKVQVKAYLNLGGFLLSVLWKNRGDVLANYATQEKHCVGIHALQHESQIQINLVSTTPIFMSL